MSKRGHKKNNQNHPSKAIWKKRKSKAKKTKTNKAKIKESIETTFVLNVKVQFLTQAMGKIWTKERENLPIPPMPLDLHNNKIIGIGLRE